jgi:aquaporin Z
MFGRRKTAALVAEFLGTGVLTLLLLSVQRSTIGVPFFIGAIAGLALAAMVLAFWRVSGSHFNPAITIAMFIARRITAIRALGYVVAQVLGAMGAYYLYVYFVKNNLQPLEGKFSGNVMTAEAVGAGLLALGYAAAKFQRFTAGMAAAATGISYMLASVLSSGAPSSFGLVNPAVALSVVNPGFTLSIQSWVLATYVLGPIIGAIVGLNLYKLLFASPEGAVVGNVIDNTTALAAAVKKDQAEVTQTTVTVVKPVRKARTTSAKTRTTAAKRAPRKKK